MGCVSRSCTGGWDWAPYSTTSQGGAATFSKGIWKSVYVAEVAAAAITHIVPQIFYKGTENVDVGGWRISQLYTSTHMPCDALHGGVPSMLG